MRVGRSHLLDLGVSERSEEVRSRMCLHRGSGLRREPVSHCNRNNEWYTPTQKLHTGYLHIWTISICGQRDILKQGSQHEGSRF